MTVTDAIEAGALKAFGTTAQRGGARRAGRHGPDPLPRRRTVSQGQAATTALANALQSGQLPQPAFTAAVDRITAVRTSLA